MTVNLTVTKNATLPDSASKTDFHNMVDGATASGTVNFSDLTGSAAQSQVPKLTSSGNLVDTGALTTASAAAGDVLYHNGTIWTRLAKDEGKYLKSGASAVSWDTPSVAAVDGMVVQVVNTQTGASATGTTAIPIDDTIPQQTEGTEFMTLAITPKRATNKLRIDVVFNLAHVDSANRERDTSIALFQDSTANALAATWRRNVTFDATSSGVNSGAMLLTYYMTAGTTSATTFKVRGGDDSGATITFNGSGGSRVFGGVMISSITITEIKAS